MRYRGDNLLNILILSAFILLTILIGIKYGFLEIAAIVLSILALIPFLSSIFLYYLKSPVISYEVGSKQKFKEGDDYIYDFLLIVKCEKGKALINDLYIGGGFGLIPLKHPMGPVNIEYFRLEETGFTTTARINCGDRPFCGKLNEAFFLRFKTSEDKENIKIKIILDIKTDPFKFGVLSVLQPYLIFPRESGHKEELVVV